MNNFALTLKMRLRVKKKLHSPDGPVDIVRCAVGLLDLKVRVTETDRRLCTFEKGKSVRLLSLAGLNRKCFTL